MRWVPLLLVAFSYAAFADSAPDGQLVHEVGAHQHGSHTECPLPKTAQDILLCVRENHPNVLRSRLLVSKADALPDAVSQLPNPSLQVQSVYGSYQNAPQMQTQISLTQPLGLGGGRSARREHAEGQARVARADLSVIQADVTFQAVLHLHRLRQLQRERAIADETLETYGKLLRQYRSRPALTPEQEVSVGTLEMADADYQLRKSALADEERQIAHFFHLSTGHSLAELSAALPKLPNPWPAFPATPPAEGRSPEVTRLTLAKESSTAELSIAWADSWPDVRLGPMVMLDQEGPRKRQFIGFELDLPLPFWNLNGAGRAAASIGVAAAERSIALQRKDESHERNEQLAAYQSAVAAVDRTPSAEKVNARHHQMEKQFLRGVVPSALILEAHRQLLDLEKSRHERELTAIRALWTLYRIDGRILEASL